MSHDCNFINKEYVCLRVICQHLGEYFFENTLFIV